MPVRAKKLSFEDIQKLFHVPTEELVETKLFLEGDHWQDAKGWVGWQPETKSTTASNDWRLIQHGFTPKNVIRGMVKRLQGAVFGKEPDWNFVAKDAAKTIDPSAAGEPKKTADETEFEMIDGVMTNWWVEKNVHKMLKRFIWNKASYGKAAIRIYVPSGYVKQNETTKAFELDIKDASDLAEVLSKIYVDTPNFNSVTDAEDDEFGESFVVIQTDTLSETPPPAGEAQPDKMFEVCYVDPDDGKTYLRQVTQAKKVDSEIGVALGGNLLSFVDGEYCDALISKPVKQQQKQLNHANTMEGYATANINFPPTYFHNAVTEVDEQDPLTGKVKKSPLNRILAGFGQWVGLVGISTQDATGGEQIATPGVTFQPIADPDKFAKVAKNKAADMHEEAGMLYVFLADNPYPSGESRVEAMTDYLILLVDYKTIMDSVGSWLLATVLRLAFNFTNQTDKNDKFNVIFSTKLTLGRIPTDDKRLMLDEVSKGVRSKRGYMIIAGEIDDPDSELKIVKADKEAEIQANKALGLGPDGKPIPEPPKEPPAK